MNQLAIELTRKCYKTKALYLDLGSCGLTDDDFIEESELDIALRKCTHLQHLVLSNKWEEWNKEKKLFESKGSNNRSGNNFFAALPPALSALQNLTALLAGGYYSNLWRIADLSLLIALPKLQSLNL